MSVETQLPEAGDDRNRTVEIQKLNELWRHSQSFVIPEIPDDARDLENVSEHRPVPQQLGRSILYMERVIPGQYLG